MFQLQPEFEPANAKLLSEMVFVVNLQDNVIFFFNYFSKHEICTIFLFKEKKKRKDGPSLCYAYAFP